MKREAEQVSTTSTTVYEIMANPTFALGVSDVRAGRAYHPDYDLWDVDGQWDYERGRAWALLAPADVELKTNGKINPKAARYFPRGDHLG